MRSVLRIVAGFTFMLAGTSKLFAFPIAMKEGGTAAFGTTIWIAGVIETFGGALLLLGLFTRPIAFVASGLMAVAYFTVHAPQSFWPTENGGVPAVLYCFTWLYFVFAGAGTLSLDRVLSRGRAEPHTPGPHH